MGDGSDASGRTRAKVDANTEKLRAVMREIGDVLAPGDADEPILAPGTRRAVFEWLAELRARDDLAKAQIKPRTTVLMSGPPGCGKSDHTPARWPKR
jgi:hypothetical protein